MMWEQTHYMTTNQLPVHILPNGSSLPLACAHVTPNHSAQGSHVLVSAGREPVWVCGYHANNYLFETLNGVTVQLPTD